jgi:hypothetical protein
MSVIRHQLFAERESTKHKEGGRMREGGREGGRENERDLGMIATKTGARMWIAIGRILSSRGTRGGEREKEGA